MNKRRKKRRYNWGRIILLLVVFIAVIFGIVFGIRACTHKEKNTNDTRTATIEDRETPPAVPEQKNEPQPKEAVHNTASKIVVLDAGHGKPSSQMSDSEKMEEGYQYTEVTESWGEWRHYKDGTFGEDCFGADCTLTAPPNGSCWYRLGNGDRDTEPEINLNNALAAKRYLEEMGYEVRMTRETNDQNPSMNKRVSYCFADNNTALTPDAALYVCIHSNAGGGSGTSYIELEDEYRQAYIPSDYNETSNRAGDIINSKIVAATGLSKNEPIRNEGYLILFNKCPVPIAYLEIGFFDNSHDLDILQSSSDEIGRAIAEGVDEYLSNS